MVKEINYIELRYRDTDAMNELLNDIDADGQTALYLFLWDNTLYYCDEPFTKEDIEKWMWYHRKG